MAQQEIAPIGFGAANYVVVVIYLLGMLTIGWWASRRVKDTKGFFIGEGNINFILVGLSLLATYLSALTMMAIPGAAFGPDNLKWSVQLPFLILTAFVITRFVLPRYREAGVVSVYEYLERRIHVSARVIGTVSFIALSVARMAIILYLPALAFSIITGFNVYAVILVMGAVVIVYSVMGGIRAVILTEAIQAVIFIAAAVMSIFYIIGAIGMGDFIRVAREHNKFQMFDWSIDLRQKVTLWLILQTIFETIRIYGTQQDMTQRYMTTESTAKANRSVWIAILGYIPLAYIFYFIGTALFVYFSVNPDANFEALKAMGRRDAIYPYFVVKQFPVALSGIIIAAILAAAMSSIAASMNSAATVCVEDLYKRFLVKDGSERGYLIVARLLTVLWGIFAVLLAASFVHVWRQGQDLWGMIMGISCNGILGLMALAFLPFRVNKWAALIGFVCCYACLYAMMFVLKINFLLWPVVGNLACFLVALGVHFIFFRENEPESRAE
ncbi:MAG: sodium/solute symporter [Planctomycetes bacterium]|nr:sodium/solute symporter [Planctomycetota bacterium]